MQQAPTVSKTEQAYQWIRERIRSREFEPGHRLVLSSIADTLLISPVPVREAIRQLEAEGLVTYEPNVGPRVSLANQNAYFETMQTVALLEGHATSLSVPFLFKSQLQRARTLNHQMENLLTDFDPETFTHLNKEFHKTLFESCPNQRLVELLFIEWERLDYYRDSSFKLIPNRARESIVEHKQLVDLIEAGADASYIEIKARDHRLRTSDRYKEALNEQHHKSTNP